MLEKQVTATTVLESRPHPNIMVIMPAAPAVKRTHVAAYCRVSTDSTEQKHSYEAQKLYFTNLYANSDEYVFAGVYADLGITGTETAIRPEFNRLLDDCSKGLIDRVVCKSISRFARNTKDCLLALRELKKLNVSVMFEKEGIDAARISDEIMITVMEGLAQEESMSISRNVRWSLKRKMAAGTLGIARVPYGYHKNENSVIEIEPKTAAVVRRIYELYLSGMGARKIAVLFNDENIPSPTGKRWSNATILKMLSQEKYIGDIRWQKTYSVFMGERGINRGETDSYYVHDGLPAIIDRDTFMKVQYLRAKASSCKRKSTNSLFKGKIRCTCGRGYYLAESRYWQCNGRTDIVRPCDSGIVSNDRLVSAWERFCRKLSVYNDMILMPLLLQLKKLEDSVLGSKMNALQEKADELRKKRYLLCQLCTESCISQEQYLNSAEEVEMKLSYINAEMERTLDNFYDAAIEVEKLYGAVKKADTEHLISMLDHAVVDGDHITFYMGNNLHFQEVL